MTIEKSESVTTRRYSVECDVGISKPSWVSLGGHTTEPEAVVDAGDYEKLCPTRIVDKTERRIIWGAGKGRKWRPV